ncbi:DUF998 domain-containing protein [Marinobacterium stanieri]|uniref:DUF998 domain-containing protein n=1 Tax=Marinobacterium stanieri TaxID=49186 RepID=UPI0004975D34|nr:DUF998 domain-containing protein [Marinobacterium stanieri]
MDILMSYTGLVASIWIVMGIYIASLFYPNFSHSKQFCSELGATGSPTQRLSPAINNYPLGLLFVLFGYYIATSESSPAETIAVGAMIIVHGVCTWICGFFPMDADPYTDKPSTSCNIHSWSGVVMLVSFIVAPAIIVFSSTYPGVLRVLSAACLVGCLFFSYTLSLAFKAKTNPGLHQRLSYGFQILWLFIYSVYTLM